MGFCSLTLLLPQPAQAGCRAECVCPGLLAAGNVEGAVEAGLRLRIGSLQRFSRRPTGRARPSIPRCTPGAGVPPRAPPQPASAARSPAERGGARSGQAPLLGGKISKGILLVWPLADIFIRKCRYPSFFLLQGRSDNLFASFVKRRQVGAGEP